MADIDTVVSWRGRTVVDQSGDKIGKFEEIYLDERQSPAWASVTTGLFGLRQTLIPLRDAQEEGDALRVPYDKDQVKDAPNVDPDEQLSAQEETVLYRHYGMQADDAAGGEGSTQSAKAADDAAGREAATQPAAADPAAAAPAPGNEAQAADRRPEAAVAAPGGEASPEPTGEVAHTEPAPAATGAGRDETAGQQQETAADRETGGDREIPLDTEVGPRERVRLKKYVVTDEVTKTVPIEREEVRVEREPFDSTGRARGDAGAAQTTETPEQSRGGEAPAQPTESPEAARGDEAPPASR